MIFKNIYKKFYLESYSFYLFLFLTLSFFILTFVLLIPNSELVKDQTNLRILLLLDTILVICLIGLLIRQIILIIIKRRKNYLSSKLHIRLINLFTLISLAPTIGVVIITALFFNLELTTWYGPAVKSTIINSNIVANDYLKLKSENLENNIQSISKDIYNLIVINNISKNQLNRINLNHNTKKLEDIFIFNNKNEIISYSSKIESEKNFLPPTKETFKILDSSKVYIIQKEKNILSAYYKLNYFNDIYLQINDDINATIYNHLIETAKAITAYKNLEENSSRIQISFSMIFVLFSTCLLLIAILIGLRLAGKLSQPIINLINSSEEVSKGNFNAKVLEINDNDELSSLIKSFNKMIVEIELQQKQLIEKNTEIEERRLFTEAVLSSLSTGVVALDNNYNLTLNNKSFLSIINKTEKEITNLNFFDIFPNLDSIKSKLNKKIYTNLSQQIEYNINDNYRNLFIKVSVEVSDSDIIGFVVTIDDLTSLILAEKHAAWSDVARKIAHEIKNPLTPIKLSAERIDKKIKENNFDKKIFTSLAQTISSQVDDIGKLIDEFSSFARLPKADIKEGDFCEVIDECYKLYSNSYTKIKFIIDNNFKSLKCNFDKLQMSLVLNNLTKNSVESLNKVTNPSITFKVNKENKYIILRIIDNGIGIKNNKIDKIFKPYYTTKEKGTGLGLSICKKIIEDHGGKIYFEKNIEKGSILFLSIHI